MCVCVCLAEPACPKPRLPLRFLEFKTDALYPLAPSLLLPPCSLPSPTPPHQPAPQSLYPLQAGGVCPGPLTRGLAGWLAAVCGLLPSCPIVTAAGGNPYSRIWGSPASHIIDAPPPPPSSYTHTHTHLNPVSPRPTHAPQEVETRGEGRGTLCSLCGEIRRDSHGSRKQINTHTHTI